MQGVRTNTLSPGVLSLSRITRSLPATITVNLSTTTECNAEKNHYETLDIPNTATISEVKAAYYKLSKMYHPDKNATEHGKQMFRGISEAYEVLGNHDSRKQYDRMLIAKSKRHQPTARGYGQPLRQSQSYAPPTYPKNMKLYDFDEWTNQHYGMTFRNDLRRRSQRQVLENISYHENEKPVSPEQSLLLVLIGGMVLLITAAIIIYESELEPKTYIRRDKPKE